MPMKSRILFLVPAVLLLLGGLFWAGKAGFAIYNSIVTLHEDVSASWSQVENTLQRRYDLIPNLVNTVKGYASHEKETFVEIARLRSQWSERSNPEAKAETGAHLESALGRLLVISENYPALQADQNFRALQDELAGTENRISIERMRYNEAVQAYNTEVRTVPGLWVAFLTGFHAEDNYFKAEKNAQSAPAAGF